MLLVASQLSRCNTSYSKLFPLLSHICRGSVSSYSTASDPDFLHHAKLSTDYFQTSLPRLPIPKLEDTCKRYLQAQLPLLTPEAHANTETIVDSFLKNEGKDLNDALIAKDKKNKHTNYVSGAWFDMYLHDRRSLVLNHNPFIAFTNEPREEYNSQLVRATNFLVSSARFMKTLKANVLEPEVFHLNPGKTDNDSFRTMMSLCPRKLSFYGAALLYKAFALDMSQYHRLFGSTRIPRPGKDELYGNPDSRHIAVMRHGNFYVFDVFDQQGAIKAPEEILAHLQYILSDNSGPAEFPLGVLSTQDRDVWANLRENLVSTAGNAAMLDKIDTSMFVLSLDDNELNEPEETSRAFLYGDGANRWFDKSFNLCLSGNGIGAVNFEHAWGDGVAVLRYFTEVYKDTTEQPKVSAATNPANVDSSGAVLKLEFELSDTVKQGIRDAEKEFHDHVSSLGMDFMKHTEHTKHDIKKYKLSPDSFMQLAFQIGFYRQYGSTVATYESCSTAAFKHGRTETIRPANTFTQKACEMFTRSTGTLPSVAEMQAILQECSKAHSQLTKEAAMGQGFDRHLFGLKNICTEMDLDLPELYKDPSYASINHNILSTSTLSSPAVLLGGFAPVVPDGFGVGYGVDDTYLGCNVTSYHKHRDVEGFVSCVEQSVVDMVNVMEGNPLK